MLNINKISIISNGKPDILSCLACASVRRACVWLWSSEFPEAAAISDNRITLIKTFQGCPHSTLLEKIQAPLVMLPIVCFLPLSSASTVLVFTHISLLCFVASSTLGLSLFQPRSSPLLTQRLPLGTWAWPIRLSLRQAWDWERERLDSISWGLWTPKV